MKHPPATQGLDQVTIVPADAWEEFFLLCRKCAQIARQRRDAVTSDETMFGPQKGKDKQPEGAESPYTADPADQ